MNYVLTWVVLHLTKELLDLDRVHLYVVGQVRCKLLLNLFDCVQSRESHRRGLPARVELDLTSKDLADLQFESVLLSVKLFVGSC